MTISKCPICGRYPKRTFIDYDDEYLVCVQMKCKTIFQKPHIVVIGRGTYDAIDEWNKTCELLRENVKEHDV